MAVAKLHPKNNEMMSTHRSLSHQVIEEIKRHRYRDQYFRHILQTHT